MDKMTKQAFTVGVLSLSALFLLIANLMTPQSVTGQVTIKERDYQAVTAPTVKGGDALYLTDNRTGLMAVFVFDPGKRSLQAVTVEPVANAFAARGGGRK